MDVPNWHEHIMDIQFIVFQQMQCLRLSKTAITYSYTIFSVKSLESLVLLWQTIWGILFSSIWNSLEKYQHKSDS